MKRRFNNQNSVGSSTYASLRSEATNEIIYHKPGPFLRYGLIGTFTFLLLLITIAWLIPYHVSIVLPAKIKIGAVVSGKRQVIPSNTMNHQQYYCELTLPKNYRSKIQNGAKVKLKMILDTSIQPLFIEGNINRLSQPLENSDIIADVTFPESQFQNQPEHTKEMPAIMCEATLSIQSGNLLEHFYKSISKTRNRLN